MAENFTIITDSSCDLPAKIAEQLHIRVIPLTLTIDGKQYNADVTYDDPTPDRLGKVSHRYFLRSDDYFTESHQYSAAEGCGQCTDSR